MRGLVLILLAFVVSCALEGKSYHGYVEGEYVYVAPTTPGILATLSVRRGQPVQKGEALFKLDKTNLEATRLSSIADIEKAKANAASAASDYARARALSSSGAVSKSDLDARKANFESAEATIRAAEQRLVQIEKQLVEAEPVSPAAGRIEDTFYREGEFVAAGTPVVSLLPPENVKIRFFVPQAALPHFALDRPVKISCDGCGEPIGAKISFIASQSEYTPPVIYSVGSRDKLVFMLEALPDVYDARLRPGLPVDITVGAP